LEIGDGGLEINIRGLEIHVGFFYIRIGGLELLDSVFLILRGCLKYSILRDEVTDHFRIELD
jgi:hypothetical protein